MQNRGEEKDPIFVCSFKYLSYDYYKKGKSGCFHFGNTHSARCNRKKNSGFYEYQRGDGYEIHHLSRNIPHNTASNKKPNWELAEQMQNKNIKFKVVDNMNLFFGKISNKKEIEQIERGYYRSVKQSSWFNGIEPGDYSFTIGGKKSNSGKQKNGGKK